MKTKLPISKKIKKTRKRSLRRLIKRSLISAIWSAYMNLYISRYFDWLILHKQIPYQSIYYKKMVVGNCVEEALKHHPAPMR